MKLHTLTIVGFVLMNIGFWPVFVMLAKRGGLGSTFASMGQAAAAFRAPAAGLETFVLWGGPPLILFGAFLCFAGVFVSDVGERSVDEAPLPLARDQVTGGLGLCDPLGLHEAHRCPLVPRLRPHRR